MIKIVSICCFPIVKIYLLTLLMLSFPMMLLRLD
jgi:hypothetical protein